MLLPLLVAMSSTDRTRTMINAGKGDSDWVLSRPSEPWPQLKASMNESVYVNAMNTAIKRVHGGSDGEEIDVVEHFFWEW